MRGKGPRSRSGEAELKVEEAGSILCLRSASGALRKSIMPFSSRLFFFEPEKSELPFYGPFWLKSPIICLEVGFCITGKLNLSCAGIVS